MKKSLGVCIGLSQCSGEFRCKPWLYPNGVGTHEYRAPTMRDVIRATKMYDVKQSRKRIMQDQRRYSRGR